MRSVHWACSVRGLCCVYLFCNVKRSIIMLLAWLRHCLSSHNTTLDVSWYLWAYCPVFELIELTLGLEWLYILFPTNWQLMSPTCLRCLTFSLDLLVIDTSTLFAFPAVTVTTETRSNNSGPVLLEERHLLKPLAHQTIKVSFDMLLNSKCQLKLVHPISFGHNLCSF